MARWRLKAWLVDRPKLEAKRHWQTDCKLCAIAKAQELAQSVAKAQRVHVDRVKWTAEKLTGGPDAWTILYHSGQRIGPLPRRHGH